MMTLSELAGVLASLGVGRGDVLHVHSALKTLGPMEGGADGVIDMLVELVGDEGLVSVPTHTWAVVNDRQPVWHELYTPSHVGALTNVLRLREGAVRSLHPTHSVAALGTRAAAFCAGHERDSSPCSPTSPYGRLLDWGGKVVMLGVDLTRCTYIHCLEEIAGLGEIWSLDPVARPRWLIRRSGEVIEVKARGHKDYKSENYGRAADELTEAGALVRGETKGAVAVYVLDARRAAEHLLPRFAANPRYFW